MKGFHFIISARQEEWCPEMPFGAVWCAALPGGDEGELVLK